MSALLFENPFWLYVLLIVAEGVLLGIWRQKRDAKSLRRLLIPPAIAALLFALSSLVVTDREKILEATGEIAKGFNAHSTEALGRYLDDDFHLQLSGQSLDKKATLAKARDGLRQAGLRKLEIKKTKIDVNGAHATMRMLTVVTLQGSFARGTFPIIWQLKWVKRGKHWKILSAQQPQFGGTF